MLVFGAWCAGEYKAFFSKILSHRLDFNTSGGWLAQDSSVADEGLTPEELEERVREKAALKEAKAKIAADKIAAKEAKKKLRCKR